VTESKSLILICDDVIDTAREWEHAVRALPSLEKGYTVEALKPGQLKDAIDELEARQLSHRRSDGREDAKTALDNAAVLIVDFDLLTLRDNNASASETGERIAYLARGYAACDYIVALNQFNRGERTVFDLTLRGHPASFADLNISSRQIANPGLWSDDRDGFRPWSWPCLHDAAAKMKKRVEFVRERLDEPVLATLGLDGKRTFPHFNREQLRFLTNERDAMGATFRELVNHSRGGLRGKDEQRGDTGQARIAAARVHKWLERMVLPGQNILIDHPHLVSRFPSLVQGGSTDLKDWQAVSRVCDPGSLPDIQTTFDHALWLSRPAWIWSTLQDDKIIAEVAEPYGRRFNDFKFAEDVSMFYVENQVRDFTPEFDSPWLTRFVLDRSELPTTDPARGGSFSIDDVDYEPGVQFAI
jgi:hypothetical protein